MEKQLLLPFSKSDDHMETIEDPKLDTILMNDRLEPELNIGEEMEQSSHVFPEQYLAPLPELYRGSLEQALMSSLFAFVNAKPLALYLHHDQSNALQIFSACTLCPEEVISYLTEQFVVWGWDRTNDTNYYRLLTILLTHTGEGVATVLDSIPVNSYPLLVCLSFTQGQINIETVIDGTTSSNEAMSFLVQARDAFDSRLELPHTTGLNTVSVSTEDWRMSASVLTQVAEQSVEFRGVVADFELGSSTIIRIDRIDNPVWLLQYINQKQIVDSRIGRTDTERLLFHGCAYSAAEEIVRRGFDHRFIGRHGTSYGDGFYFSSSRMFSDGYARVSPSNNGERRILMCRVLVGESCQGSSTMRTCPSRYDSTTDGSKIFVVYSNRQILPEYLITYR